MLAVEHDLAVIIRHHPGQRVMLPAFQFALGGRLEQVHLGFSKHHHPGVTLIALLAHYHAGIVAHFKVMYFSFTQSEPAL